MIIRFIKHLVRITVRNNSFYVSVGLSRLLHNYTTAEAMDIYGAVVQDSDRMKEDHYYRSRKRRLMQELQDRFGRFITRIRASHGEERFLADSSSTVRVKLVSKCLKQFTPWETDCVVPARFDAREDELAALSFKGNDPDEEHPVEVNRMHAIVEPDCYKRIASGLRLDSPEERLSVPRFQIAKEGNNGSGRRGDSEDLPQLGEAEAEEILGELAELAERRKRIKAKFLLMVADGEEVARLDISRERRVKFEVKEDAEIIEVRARDKEGNTALLAVHVMSYPDMEGEDKAEEYEMELGEGHKIRLTILMKRDSCGEIAGASIEVGYEEASVVKAAVQYLRQAKNRSKASGEERREESKGKVGPHRRIVFGEMSQHTTTDTRRYSTGFISSMSEQTENSLFITSSLSRLYYMFLGKVASYDKLGSRIIAGIKTAQAFRDVERVRELSQILINLPSKEHQLIADYYLIWCRHRESKYDAEALERIIEQSQTYKTQVLFTRGAIEGRRGDYKAAMAFYTEALKTSPSITEYIVLSGSIAALKATEGFHQSALRDLENLLPMIRYAEPQTYYNYLNSYAVELGEAGRKEEARNMCKAVLASPFAFAYPEWRETAQELKPANRSFTVVGA